MPKTTATITKLRIDCNTSITDCEFNWYRVRRLGTNNFFYALPNDYGVIYIDELNKDVNFSSRDFFNEKYELIEEYLGTINLTLAPKN